MKKIDNKIFLIESPNEFYNLKRDNLFINKCTKCGEYRKPTKFRRNRISNYVRMLCTDCLNKYISNEKYGTDYKFQSDAIKEKIKQTNLEKYRVSCSLLNKDVKLKTIETNIKRYGVQNPSQSEFVKSKMKQTCVKRYGEEYSLQSSEVRKKIKGTCIKKYNVDNPWKSEIIKNKIKQTNVSKYGVVYPSQSESVKEKIKSTCMKKYGEECYTKTERYRKSASDKIKSLRLKYPEMFLTKCYIYNGLSFDSIPEFSVYLYCTYHWVPIIRNHTTYFEYKDNKNDIHRVYPDFIINGQLVEIKGAHFFKDNGTMYLPYRKPEWSDVEYNYMCDLYERKRQCLINNGVLILKDTDIWVQNCINWVKNIININDYMKSNPNNICYGYTPYNCNKDIEYQKCIGIGLTPFDIGNRICLIVK